MDSNLGANLDTINHVKSTLIDLAIRFGPKLLVAIVILVAGGMVARWLGRVSERGLLRFELEPPVRLLLVRLERVLVFMLFLILALQNLGVELLPLIAGISVAGAGLALATQGVLSNVVAGLTIIFTKPYRVGDYIAIVGVEGQVILINVFSTTLMHADRSRVVVPNRKIVGEILHNYAQVRQAEINVGVGYDVDLPQALSSIRAVVVANKRVLSDPAPVVQVSALADSTVRISVKPWVASADFGAVSGELSLAIIDACRQQRISMPLPQYEVRLLGAGTHETAGVMADGALPVGSSA